MKKILTAKGIPITNLKKPYFEQIVIYEDGYPIVMVHCDLFYPGDDPDCQGKDYDSLMSGEEIEFTMEFN